MTVCKTITACILTTALLLLSSTATLQAATETVVRIGFNYPKSGPYAQIGFSQYQGALLAADEINSQGGILGRKIELVFRDSGSHVRKTRGNIQELLEQEKVQMVFGGVSSDVAVATCDLCQEKWVPFFATLSYSTATTEEEAHRACFHESYNAWMAAKLLATYMNQHFKGKRYFYITTDYSWGWTTEQSLRKLTNTDATQYHRGVRTRLGSTNFFKSLQQAEAMAPDVLVLILAGMDLETALRQAQVMGFKERTQIIVPNLIRTDIVRIGPKAMEGVIGTMPWYWQVPYIYDYPQGIKFVERFKERYADYPTSAAASAYTILHEYKSAAERAGSFKGPEVITALEGHTYQSVKDAQSWRAFDHQSIQTVYLVRGKPLVHHSKQKTVKEHIDILDSMPGQDAVRSYKEWLTIRRLAGKTHTLEPLPEP